MALDTRINFNEHDALGQPFGVQGILKAMDRYGIESAALISSLAVNSDFRLGNRYLQSAIQDQDRLFGYLVLNPNYPDETVAMMRAMMGSRKFVAAALFTGSTRPYPNLDDYREILKAYRRYGKPVFVNTPHVEAVAAAEVMAKEFTNVKFILGTMGGDSWKRSLLSAGLLNVVLETSGSFDAEKIEAAVTAFGPHRILFGSDLPYSDPISMLALIQNSSIPKDAVSKILEGNARRLLNMIPPTGAEETPEPGIATMK